MFIFIPADWTKSVHVTNLACSLLISPTWQQLDEACTRPRSWNWVPNQVMQVLHFIDPRAQVSSVSFPTYRNLAPWTANKHRLLCVLMCEPQLSTWQATVRAKRTSGCGEFVEKKSSTRALLALYNSRSLVCQQTRWKSVDLSRRRETRWFDAGFFERLQCIRYILA